MISIKIACEMYSEILFILLLINVSKGAQRTPLAETKCPAAAQRKQVKRACTIYSNISRNTILIKINKTYLI